MATRINITQIANFDIHNESNLAQQWEKWKESFEFYLGVCCMNNDSQMRALLLRCAGTDGEDIFMHLQDMQGCSGCNKQPF